MQTMQATQANHATGKSTCLAIDAQDFQEVGDRHLAVVVHVCSAVDNAAKLGQGRQNV